MSVNPRVVTEILTANHLKEKNFYTKIHFSNVDALEGLKNLYLQLHNLSYKLI